MNELEIFRTEIITDANNAASVSSGETQPSEAFGQLTFELVSETGELSGEIYACTESGAHSNGAKYRIDGYCIEEIAESDGYETISVFVVHYSEGADLKKLSKSDFDSALKQGVRFVSDAMRGHLGELENSSPAFDFVRSLSKNRREVERIFVHLITDQVCEQQIPKTTSLPHFDDVSVSFRIWDINRLYEIELSEKGHTPIVVDFVEREGYGIPCLPMPSKSIDYECYLAIVRGEVLANLYQEYGARLLESNVRAFLQQSIKVNKGIRETIRRHPGMFLPYNNGLAATAKDVVLREVDGKVEIQKVEDLQIVNGGQTTASLYHTRRKDKDASLDEVYVQMKLTVLRDDEKFAAIVPAISRYANSQTKVSELDLSSNHPLLQELQRVADRTFAKNPMNPNVQTLWFFERVKGQYREALAKVGRGPKQKAFEKKHPKSQKIDKAKLAKYMMAYHALPFWIARGAQKNYVKFIEVFEKEFSSRGKSELKPGPSYWRAVVSNGIIFSAFEKLFGRKGHNPIGDSNVRAPSVAYSMSLLHDRTNSCFDLELVWKSQAVPSELEKVFKAQLIWVYKRLTLEEGLVSERAKKMKTWDEMRARTDDPFSSHDWSNYVLSEEETKKYRASWSSQVSGLDANTLSQVSGLGLSFWQAICLMGSRGEIDSKDYDIANRIKSDIIRGRSLNNSIIQKALAVVDRLESSGVDIQKLKEQSGEEESTFDVARALVRIRDLNSSDWNAILGFEELVLKGSRINSKQWQSLRNTKRKLAERQDPNLTEIENSILCIDEINRRFKKSF